MNESGKIVPNKRELEYELFSPMPWQHDGISDCIVHEPCIRMAYNLHMH